MTQEFPQDTKAQYAQGPQQQKQYTEEELATMRKKQEETLDELLPYLRKQAEYDALKIQMFEQDVMLGKIGIDQVPVGLLQLELKVREIQAHGFLANYIMGQKAAQEQAKQEQEMISKMTDEEKAAYEEFKKLSPEDQMKWQQEAIDKYNRDVEAKKVQEQQ